MSSAEFNPHLLRVSNGSAAIASPVSWHGKISEQQLEEFIVANPQLAGEDLLVLGRQLKEFQEDDKRLDVLAVDRDGEIVLLELKVDHEFGVTDLQALAYAAAYANKTREHFAATLQRWMIRTGNAEASIDDAREALIEFLGFESFDDWEPSQHVRIKLVAPGFPKRVLATVKWLGDLYDVRIEAITIRLFETAPGDYQLTFDRVLPLPGADAFDMTTREREKRKREENIARRPDVLNFLLKKGILADSQKLWLGTWVLPAEDRDGWASDDPRLEVLIKAHPSAPKLVWQPPGESEPLALSPSTVPYHVLTRLFPEAGEFRKYRSVHDKFRVAPDGHTLGEIAESHGWTNEDSVG